MNIFYSDSKTDSAIKFHLFEGAQDAATRLTAVCCMLLPHNPYILHQHYKRHVCGSYCSCKHWFLWIYPIFEHWLCLNYMGTVRHWQPFWTSTRVRLIGQCWYFIPQWTPKWPIIKAHSVSQLEKMCSYKVSSYISVFVEGFRRWRGTFWLLNGVLQHS